MANLFHHPTEPTIKEFIYAMKNTVAMIGVVAGSSHAIARVTFTRASKMGELARSIMKWGMG